MYFTSKNIVSFLALPLAINAVAIVEPQAGAIMAREAQGKHIDSTS
jgi:hypothetical protein